jgi:RNA polymerase sigma-70 factor (ECF subfamily)
LRDSSGRHSPIDSRVREVLEKIYAGESRRILATLIRLLGDFDLAEDAMHDAFAAAAEQWPGEGVPSNPRAWLVSAGRFKAIDALRRHSRFETTLNDVGCKIEAEFSDPADRIDNTIEDDELRLIFTCCHPALSPDARVPLTLREVCGLTTEEIARAFLTTPSTIAQRIVRAKAKIREARIPYAVPSQSDLAERLDTVLHVIYLVFNEGYSATFGASLTRSDLSGEAIRLGRLLLHLLTMDSTKSGRVEPEVKGLLALMLLQESRRAARATSTGDLILLEEQDRSVWDRDLIHEGIALVEEALSTRQFGSFTVQAAIAAVHAEAATSAATDWPQIVGLYEVLMRMEPSPVVELNRAVAVAMRDGPQSGLDLIDGILSRGDLREYHLAYSARGELCKRLGKKEDARASYQKALSFAHQEPERRFLEKRLNELEQVLTDIHE